MKLPYVKHGVARHSGRCGTTTICEKGWCLQVNDEKGWCHTNKA